MGDLLRSLGIPVRLVNGFGPGTFNATLGQYVVRESDAHTWPEVYFPGYGWIRFEPTPQATYAPIPRGSAPLGCVTVACAGAPAAPVGAGSRAAPGANPGEAGGAGSGGGAAQGHPGPGPLPVALAALLLLLGICALAAIRWLRPRSMAAIWRRTRSLARIAGVPRDRGETPIEFGRRLGSLVPAAADAAHVLAEQVTVASYAPDREEAASQGSVEEAWSVVRGQLLRRLLRRRRGAPDAE